MNNLFLLYIILAVLNLTTFLKSRTNWGLAFITFAYLLVILYNSDYQNQHDLISYMAQFEQYDAFQNEEFKLYYIFFSLMGLGQSMGLSFVSWWLMLNAIIFLNFSVGLKIHKFNPNAFLFFFLIYYFITLYTGVKALLGLSVFFIGVGYLFKGDGRKSKLMFVAFTLLAGACHSMYYFYLILLLADVCGDPNGRILFVSKKTLLKLLITFSIVSSIFLKASGSAQYYLANIFSFMESEKIDSYFELETQMGFFIPVIMQLLSMLLAYKTYKSARSLKADHFILKGNLYFSNLMCVLYYPLFMIALTFMRLITAFSFVTICASFYDIKNVDTATRKKIFGFAMLIIIGFYYRKFFLGNMWELSIVPLFSL